MADISKITIESGTYNIKDKYVRELLSNVNLNNPFDVPTIMIGDSYAVGESAGSTITGWCDRLKNLLGLSNQNFYKIPLSGLGFVTVPNFTNGLNDYGSNISDKSKIKSIIVCGGYNDARLWTNLNDLENKINQFIDFCHTYYPNATVYIGMVGNSGAKTENGILLRRLLNNEILTKYQQCGDNRNARYLNGVENILHYNNLISSDTIHPTDAGYKFLAKAIYQSYTTGYAPINSAWNTFNVSSNSTNPSTITGNALTAAIHGETVTLRSEQMLTFAFNSIKEFNQEAIKICDFNCNVILPNVQIDIPVKFHTSDENVTGQGINYYGGMGILKLNGWDITLDTQTINPTNPKGGWLQGSAMKKLYIKPFTTEISIRNV